MVSELSELDNRLSQLYVYDRLQPASNRCKACDSTTLSSRVPSFGHLRLHRQIGAA